MLRSSASPLSSAVSPIIFKTTKSIICILLTRLPYRHTTMCNCVFLYSPNLSHLSSYIWVFWYKIALLYSVFFHLDLDFEAGYNSTALRNCEGHRISSVTQGQFALHSKFTSLVIKTKSQSWLVKFVSGELGVGLRWGWRLQSEAPYRSWGISSTYSDTNGSEMEIML